ncbi:MAG: hypothetical protein KC766_28605 [Myxococcales bacterium]|nr:hypothetical protein [Myxococcales bacterium]
MPQLTLTPKGAWIQPTATRRGHLAAHLIAELIAPALVFYGLRGLGVRTALALVGSGVLPATVAVVRYVRRRRLDWIAVFAGVLFLLGGVAVLLGQSPRTLFLAGSLVPLGIALWMAASHFARQPLAFRFALELLPQRRERLEQLWDERPKFRQRWRAVSWMWIGGLLFDATARGAVTAFAPADSLPALHTALAIATPLVLQLVTNLYLARTGVFRAMFR